MAKDPAFLFYAQDFLMGTAHMTADEVGGYTRLLCHQWDKDGLPNDDAKLLAMSGLKPKSLFTVKEKFVLCDDNKLRNYRLEFERDKRKGFLQKSSEAGKKSGEMRRMKKMEKEAEKNEPNTNQPSIPVQTKDEPTTEHDPQPNANISFSSSISISDIENKEIEIDSKGAENPPAPANVPPAVAKSPDKITQCKQREKQFSIILAGYVNAGTYTKEMVRAFYNYWSEPNKSKTKMKFELERTWDVARRLSTWEQRDQKFKTKPEAAKNQASNPIEEQIKKARQSTLK